MRKFMVNAFAIGLNTKISACELTGAHFLHLDLEMENSAANELDEVDAFLRELDEKNPSDSSEYSDVPVSPTTEKELNEMEESLGSTHFDSSNSERDGAGNVNPVDATLSKDTAHPAPVDSSLLEIQSTPADPTAITPSPPRTFSKILKKDAPATSSLSEVASAPVFSAPKRVRFSYDGIVTQNVNDETDSINDLIQKLQQRLKTGQFHTAEELLFLYQSICATKHAIVSKKMIEQLTVGTHSPFHLFSVSRTRKRKTFTQLFHLICLVFKLLANKV